MKEYPILFSGEMVQAILDGRKTQTRRVIKLQTGKAAGIGECHYSLSRHAYSNEDGSCTCQPVKSPYGQPGDRLWVREKFAVVHGEGEKPTKDDYLIYATDASQSVGVIDFVKAWRPSIFMPRVYSRITLEVASVRVERLQDISDEDARKEGVQDICHCGDYIEVHGYHSGHSPTPMDGYAANEFSILWDSINTKRGYPWESNPWVWCISFKKIT